jgi:hypothetical protein
MRWMPLLVACHAATPAASPSPPSKACAAPESRQLDFWVGDWDVTVHARNSPTSDTWGTAPGHQHVEAILGGCAIAETFAATGPGPAWAGRSYAMYQGGKWKQTWVDDQGGYLLFTGGPEAGASMVLYGEPREQNGKTIQMRMVFHDVTATSLEWEWQRTDDAWATNVVMMKIDYKRS